MRHLTQFLMAVTLLACTPFAANADLPDRTRESDAYSATYVADHRRPRQDRYDRDRYRDRRGYYYYRPYQYYYRTPRYYYGTPQYYDFYYYPRGGSVQLGPLRFYWR